jgi:3-oxoacid CoA-transferase subunit B
VGVVNQIITEMAVIEVTAEGLVLRELAKGVTAEQVQSATEPRLIVAGDLKAME